MLNRTMVKLDEIKARYYGVDKNSGKPKTKKLSKYIKPAKEVDYAFCSNCGELWIDDLDITGTLRCPYCFRIMHRGVVDYSDGKDNCKCFNCGD